MEEISDELIKHIILDYDGVFTNDDYTTVFNAFKASTKASGNPQTRDQINTTFDEIEWKYVLIKEQQPFLDEIRNAFHYKGTDEEIRAILNDRGDTGFLDILPQFQQAGLTLSILSNQIAYRVPHVREHLESGFGLENFQHIYFSPEVGLQKPFVGVAHDTAQVRDIADVDIFPLVVRGLKSSSYEPGESVFIDDSAKNITSANSYGIKGIIYKSTQQVLKELREDYGIEI